MVEWVTVPSPPSLNLPAHNPLVKASNRLWADQRIRFLIIGGINTAIGLAFFTLFEIAFGHYLGFLGTVSLVLSYAFAIPIAFLLHRKFVFRVRGNAWIDFGRFVLTNLLGMGLNLVLLPLIVVVTHIDTVIAQPIAQVIIVFVTYFIHKHFSFRRKAHV